MAQPRPMKTEKEEEGAEGGRKEAGDVERVARDRGSQIK